MLSSVVTHCPQSKVAPPALIELRRACQLFEQAASYGGRAVKFLVWRVCPGWTGCDDAHRFISLSSSAWYGRLSSHSWTTTVASLPLFGMISLVPARMRRTSWRSSAGRPTRSLRPSRLPTQHNRKRKRNTHLRQDDLRPCRPHLRPLPPRR
jgi:hypothetical protein